MLNINNMKKFILSLLILASFGAFSQGVVPVSTNIGKLPYLDLLQIYKAGNDSSLIEIYQDSVKFRTNQDAYTFNKHLFVKGINIAEGGTITIDSQSITSLDTANIVYKTTIDTIFETKTFENGIINIDETSNGAYQATNTGSNSLSYYSYGTGSSAKGFYGYNSGNASVNFWGENYGNDGFVSQFSSYGYRTIPMWAYSLHCDTILQLYKSTTEVLGVLNSTSSVNFNSSKNSFLFNKPILIGTNASLTDFPLANFISSKGNTGHTYTGNIGTIGEAIAGTSDTGTGVGGVASTNAANQGRGVAGVGKVSASGDTGASIGGYFRSEDTHSGGVNVGMSCRAVNGNGNYAISLAGGDISSLTTAPNWLLYDNQTSALSFDASEKTGLLKFVTTNGSEKITMSGVLEVTGNNSVGNVQSTTTAESAVSFYSYSSGRYSTNFQGENDANDGITANFISYGYRTIPLISQADYCDTLLHLKKYTTSVLLVENATSSIKLNSSKDLFEFNKHLSTPEVTKAHQTLTYAASVTMNTNIGANAKITLTGNCALTLSNLTNGDEGNIIVIQDGTGGRTITISPTPKVINGGAGVVTLSTTANSIDIISYTYDGTNLYINYGKNYN